MTDILAAAGSRSHDCIENYLIDRWAMGSSFSWTKVESLKQRSRKQQLTTSFFLFSPCLITIKLMLRRFDNCTEQRESRFWLNQGDVLEKRHSALVASQRKEKKKELASVRFSQNKNSPTTHEFDNSSPLIGIYSTPAHADPLVLDENGGRGIFYSTDRKIL